MAACGPDLPRWPCRCRRLPGRGTAPRATRPGPATAPRPMAVLSLRTIAGDRREITLAPALGDEPVGADAGVLHVQGIGLEAHAAGGPIFAPRPPSVATSAEPASGHGAGAPEGGFQATNVAAAAGHGVFPAIMTEPMIFIYRGT
jgi:hypothetical protein